MLPATLAAHAIGFTGAFCGLIYALTGLRMCDRVRAATRVAAAVASIVAGAFAYVGTLSPVVAYGLICLALSSVYVLDVLRDEGARRRRVVSLEPRPFIGMLPAAWLTIPALSIAMLVPYARTAEFRTAVVLVALCVAAIVAIGVRIATAPVALEGCDEPRIEALRERRSRYQTTGMCAVSAVGAIMVFISFSDATATTLSSLQWLFLPLAMALWIGLALWVGAYTLYLYRMTSALS